MPTDRRSWDSLSDLVVRAMPASGRLPGSASLREAAALLAVEVWGPARVESASTLLNVAALAVATGDLLEVALVGPSARALVAREAAALERVDALPALLARPWIVEASDWRGGGSLWGECWSLGGYGLGDSAGAWLVGLVGEGARVEGWRPDAPGDPAAWVRADPMAFLPGVTHQALHVAWAREATRYACALGAAIEGGRVEAVETRRVGVAAGQLAVVTTYGVPGARKPRGTVDRRKHRGS